jgi:molybdopterin molybdotransferase
VSRQDDSKRVLEFEEARDIVITTVRSLAQTGKIEDIALTEAHGRTLAEPVAADRDYPTLRRSLRDGFAVRSSEVPGVLRVRGELRAGQAEPEALEPGEALEIMTGAPVPAQADAVVMVEHVVRTSASDGTPNVRIDRTAEFGQFINERGAEAPAGKVLVEAGVILDASHIATLAMTGHTSVRVFAKPSVAILATGDEIVELSVRPSAHQIRNSNSYMLAACVAAAGGVPRVLPIARDQPDVLRSSLLEGLPHDMLLVSGGVSAGRYDLVKPALQELGAVFHFERVRIQPGGPTAFGSICGKPVFGLPGNPGSSLVTFQLFAQPALELLSGVAQPILPLLRAEFEAPFRHRPGLTRFLPARLSADGHHLRHIPWQGSSDIPALAQANVFLVAEHNREAWDIGDSIRVMRKI